MDPAGLLSSGGSSKVEKIAIPDSASPQGNIPFSVFVSNRC